jgi:hypothetical protein
MPRSPSRSRPRLLARQGRSPGDILGPLHAAGYCAYRVPNDYAVDTYPAAIRRPRPPRRWDGPVTEMTDLVLSRTDASQLA